MSSETSHGMTKKCCIRKFVLIQEVFYISSHGQVIMWFAMQGVTVVS